MKFLQKLGKSLMLPVSCLPICGLLMGIGYMLCPAAMQGGEMTGIAAQIGFFLVKAGGALVDHIALLFAIGVGIGMSENNDGAGGLAALVSWLVITVLLNPETVKVLIPSAAEDTGRILAYSKVENPFIGILTGVIGSVCYNRFHRTKLPDWLSFFSGKRSVAIVAGVASVAVSFILLFVWPVLFSGLTAMGNGIAGMGAPGAAIYATLNRLLIPVGLHHALNNVFWFDTIGLGDLTAFWAGKTSADVSWSLGMYMSGFFPCMMFGIPAAALAMIHSAKKNRRKATAGILLSCAVCSFVCGVTEPFEFAFMFLSPILYLIYAALYGIITYITVITGFRAGFCFSAGATDLVFSASLPAAANTWLILPLGALAFILFYAVFRFAIRKWNIKTPGSEDDAGQAPGGEGPGTGGGFSGMAETILRGIGGAGNVVSIDHCITRLRLEVKDISRVDETVIRSVGVPGVIRPGGNALQVVVGTKVQFVADELKQICSVRESISADAPEESGKTGQPAPAGGKYTKVQTGDPVFTDEDDIVSPADGELIPMKDIPDEVFSSGVMGECVGILTEQNTLYAPVSGTVSVVAETGHAVSIRTEGEEILIHAGLDTVKMNGEGFTVRVREGESVEKGQPVMDADMKLIREKGFNPVVIVARIPD